MNDQSQIQMMNQQPPPHPVQSQMLNQQSQMMSQNPQVLNPIPPQILSQSQAMNQHPQMMNPVQSQMLNQIAQSQGMNQPMMMNRSYMPWPKQDPSMKYQNPLMNPGFVPSKPRSNWKGKKGITDKRKEQRRSDKPFPIIPNNASKSGPGGSGGYKPPTLHELQSQNRLKARKFYPNKKFNNRFAPYAPRNTTSFIIRAKKAGGIAELVSPCPVTPAVLPTPMFSPSREVLGDMAKEEWGVDGYGSMKGLIRLRSSPGNEDDEEEEGGGSSESDVEEHVEVERRLDHDLSRFEMIYPNYGGMEYHNVLENRVDDQDSHITQLEEENLTLKERLFLMEREMGELRRRLLALERRGRVVQDVNEGVVENLSEENESEGGGSDVGDNNEAFIYASGSGEGQSVHIDTKELVKGVGNVCTEEFVPNEMDVKNDVSKDEVAGNEFGPVKVISNKDEAAVENSKEDGMEA
ncbi:hypothetical protein HS088_TW23G00225 [Tripterygium wilfordii]|uniref:PRLI-interacting factor A n=1 Tax=Tripterygium wilfordii TaxID=458696 RepID=A0A7J7BU81_TRIWF|nr:uncharacterized protein LOC119993246 [Tripterygium wilfordii]XP_038696200.1 uncharacterized protein LOC119993246 [Tripterygium wilfordii]XP_038696201.1 uncharacterized protein LOC119993246 [Tripterygium wilfordii]XP_038696202.1 uncharacterized protein LOC119993246 [Tripterygium wilfordii]XP_038696203.1 uncharacterized protein LOC119993246 [Tripterygium wilfordii]XP_038696204.1 uncharacterized protein LOC119993246 [Tripterygium wilfordii]XP_038696205.1 uncharacterized protein LOC119993246 [